VIGDRGKIQKSCARAGKSGLDPWVYLEDNDAYHFSEQLGDLLVTGPTNTNVMDVRLLLVEPEEHG
jgi:hydroxypyruvate reductase